MLYIVLIVFFIFQGNAAVIPIPAQNVIGQSNFTSNSTGIFNFPIGISQSSVSGKLFVSNSGAAGITRFSNASIFITGASPEINFGTGLGCDSSHFFNSYDVFVDTNDDCWILDYFQNRLLVFANASNINITNPSAIKVFGAPNFTECSGGSGLNQIKLSQGLFVDNIRDILWIADSQNNRILRFDNYSSKPNMNAYADVVLGTTGSVGCSATLLNSPSSLIVDTLGNLWVSDQLNARILRYDNAHIKINGSVADLVLGQNNLGICASGTTQTKFNAPADLTFDLFGNLYVTDFQNNRVLGFINAISYTLNFQSAGFQVGQPDFNSSGRYITSQTNINHPFGIIYTSESILVVSLDENRVMRYYVGGLPSQTPSITSTSSFTSSVTISKSITISTTSSETLSNSATLSKSVSSSSKSVSSSSKSVSISSKSVSTSSKSVTTSSKSVSSSITPSVTLTNSMISSKILTRSVTLIRSTTSSRSMINSTSIRKQINSRDEPSLVNNITTSFIKIIFFKPIYPEKVKIRKIHTHYKNLLSSAVDVKIKHLDQPIQLCFKAKMFEEKNIKLPTSGCYKSEVSSSCLAFLNANNTFECVDYHLNKSNELTCGIVPHLSTFAILLYVKSETVCAKTSILFWIAISFLIFDFFLIIVVVILEYKVKYVRQLVYGESGYKDVEYRKWIEKNKKNEKKKNIKV